MAIYSLHHSAIGRTTHAPGTAGAHLAYIARTSACTAILGDGLPPRTLPTPGKVGQARGWIDDEERQDRKNARVIDKFTLALPVELDAAQRMELVRDFAGRLTNGEAPWLAAIHDRGKDAHNPHCHFVLRDRHVVTGKRAVGMSEKGSTERVRQIWEQTANDALTVAGTDARIDRRSLKAQGIDRVPQGHEGPRAQSIEARAPGASTKIARIEDARRERDAKRAAEREATRIAAQAAERAAEAQQAREREERRRVAERADRALQAAEAAQRKAQADRAEAERRRDVLEAILDGRRDLHTGQLTPEARKAVLPPNFGPRLTPEEQAEAEHRAAWCDEDGHENIPVPPPAGEPGEYADRAAFEAAQATWDRDERTRIDRVAKAKQRLWDEGLPAVQRDLGRAEDVARRATIPTVAHVTMGPGLVKAARAAFAWMRQRVATARATLGGDHPTAQRMERDRCEVLAEHPGTLDALRQSSADSTRRGDVFTAKIREDAERMRQEVHQRREADRARQAQRNAYRGPSGPGM